ncbi:TAXI family TRAP transporter solute-binding subunit [Fluviibacter phosphoraccumulans]|jgi:TRAP-type uncharacterized transport system substrate-binding protein|uniref:TAXI family TRAP transporter solute-binding subunit n=1 Tax=Fluviibacter phosphoraccumulans TaxID=1751046 RepID=UPI0024E1CE41|nr:TAXI family TRAP transporter solute-binding subunit [Fluviibacter phosphoraccumulans]
MGSVREDLRDQVVAIHETATEAWSDVVLFIRETWPALIVLLTLLILALWIADPAPPRHVSMATGPAGSSNEALGKKYAAYFAEQGITLKLVPTEGSVENVKRLQDKDDPVMAAFVMAGAAPPHAERIQTLGSIDYQPLWCFYRSPIPIVSPTQRMSALLSKTLNVGTPNSGTFLLAERVLGMLGIQPDASNQRHLPDEEAIEALRKGQLDALCVVDTYESPNVQKLLKIDGLQLSGFERAEAYTRLVSSIEQVSIPPGGLDLPLDRPSQSMDLISVTTEILIDERLHPAIQTLFLMAARSINGKQSFFSQEGEFPAFKDSSLKRSGEAETFYEKGTPVLMEFMPFWLAEFIRRVILTMLPFFAIAYPVIRSMPNYHKNRVRGRINRMYGSLKFFEQELISSYDPVEKQAYLNRLDSMERDALSMKVPKSVSSDYYTLRSSIDFVRNCLVRDGYAIHLQSAQPVPQPGFFDREDDGDE